MSLKTVYNVWLYMENKLKNNLLIFFSSLLKEWGPNLTDEKSKEDKIEKQI